MLPLFVVSVQVFIKISEVFTPLNQLHTILYTIPVQMPLLKQLQ